MSPLGDQSSEIFNESSQSGTITFWNSLKTWIGLIFRLHLESHGMRVVWLISLVPAFLAFTASTNKPTFQNECIANLTKIVNFSTVRLAEITSYVSPDTENTKRLIHALFPNQENIVVYEKDRISAFNRVNKNSSRDNICAYNVLTNDDLTQIDFSFDSTCASITAGNFSNLIYNKLYDTVNITTYNGNFSKPKTLDITRSMGDWISIFLATCLVLVFCANIFTFIKWNHNKIIILLQTAGIKERVIWLGFILYNFIFVVIFALIVSIAIIATPVRHAVNFFFLFFFYILYGITLFFACAAWIPLFQKPILTPILIFFIIGTNSLALVFPPTQRLFEGGSVAVEVMKRLTPTGSAVDFEYNIFAAYYRNQHAGITNMSIGEFATFNGIFGLLFTQLIFSAIGLILLILLLPKEHGTPKIGFDNIFKLKYWTSLFKRRKNISEDNAEHAFLDVKKLTKYYTDGRIVKAVDGVDFSIGKGEVILLIGPNGSGKTTLLESLTGGLQVTEGSIKIFGSNARFFDLQTCTGFCYQENVFFESLSVRKHLEFFGRLRGATQSQIADQIDFMSDKLMMTEFLDSSAKILSAGQARTVMTAMAYIGAPPLVILDEPTSGVDVNRRMLLWSMAGYFKNTTTIIASHSLEEGETVSDRLFVMEKGKIIFMGTASELRREYKCGYRIRIISENEEDLDEIVEKVLEYTQKIIPEAVIDFERGDCVMVPVESNIPSFMESLDKDIQQLGGTGYTITVEALEDIMLRMIQEGDEY